MNSRLGCLSVSGALIAGLVLLVVAGWTFVGGPVLFSPGGLNAVSKAQPLGGVSSHAALGAKCDACHTAPWSSQTMAQRCLACHSDVAGQMQSGSGLHARMAGTPASPTCRQCHTDHHGPNGLLTYFDHSKLPFKLTGKHTTVACDLCHPNAGTLQAFQATPTDCYSCHAKDDKHSGTFGRQCDQCHSTNGWANANFDHRIFPVTHGSRERVATCETCHPLGTSSYSCFGCHAHTPANVVAGHEGGSLAQLTNCVRCHPQGRVGD